MGHQKILIQLSCIPRLFLVAHYKLKMFYCALGVTGQILRGKKGCLAIGSAAKGL